MPTKWAHVQKTIRGFIDIYESIIKGTENNIKHMQTKGKNYQGFEVVETWQSGHL